MRYVQCGIDLVNEEMAVAGGKSGKVKETLPTERIRKRSSQIQSFGWNEVWWVSLHAMPLVFVPTKTD